MSDVEYTLVGLVNAEVTGQYDGLLTVLVSADPIAGTESATLGDTKLPEDARIFTRLQDAMRFGGMLHRMDSRLSPPFNPVLAEVMDSRLLALLMASQPEKIDKSIRTAALRYGIRATRLEPS